jgi:hypothetical protein
MSVMSPLSAARSILPRALIEMASLSTGGAPTFAVRVITPEGNDRSRWRVARGVAHHRHHKAGHRLVEARPHQREPTSVPGSPSQEGPDPDLKSNQNPSTH